MPDRSIFTRQIVAGYLDEVSREVLASLIRASHSLNIKERHDCSSGIFDITGGTVALTSVGGIHLGSMLGLVDHLLRTYPIDDIASGDIFLVNDPYGGGGSHLPDFTMASPIISAGEMIGFVANIAHQSDIGGSRPGSISGDAREIFAEGLRIPIVRLARDGVVNDDLLRLIYLNSRLPHERQGDLQAQIGSLRVGLRRMDALLAKYGVTEVRRSMDEITAYAERRIRAEIHDVPDGRYVAEDFLDADETLESKVRIRLTLIVDGDQLRFDFEGTDGQIPTAKNVPLTALRATVYTVVKQMIDPGLPPNAGYYRAIDVVAPPGSLVNPEPPGAVGDRALTCNIIGDVLTAALSQAMPDRAIAGSGPYTHSILSGRQPNGRVFVNFEALAGSEGALVFRDGMDAVRVHASGGLNQSVEAMEIAFPVLVEAYQLVTDSGGVGRYRGGLATCRRLRALADRCEFTGTSGRATIPARGVNGGGDGSLAGFTFNPGAPNECVPGINFSGFKMDRGDVMQIMTASGAGFGDPLERPPEDVAEDVREGRVSVEAARAVYGVVIVAGEVDSAATSQLRNRPVRTASSTADSTLTSPIDQSARVGDSQ